MTSMGVRQRGGPGISRSIPALIAWSTLYVPNLYFVSVVNIRGRRERERCVPVAHDDAVEAPFVAEDTLQELGVLGAVYAPNAAVPGHGVRTVRESLHA